MNVINENKDIDFFGGKICQTYTEETVNVCIIYIWY